MTEQNQYIRVEARTASSLCKEILELSEKRLQLSRMESEAEKQLKRLYKQLEEEHNLGEYEANPRIVGIDGSEYLLLIRSSQQYPDIVKVDSLKRISE